MPLLSRRFYHNHFQSPTHRLLLRRGDILDPGRGLGSFLFSRANVSATSEGAYRDAMEWGPAVTEAQWKQLELARCFLSISDLRGNAKTG